MSPAVIAVVFSAVALVVTILGLAFKGGAALAKIETSLQGVDEKLRDQGERIREIEGSLGKVLTDVEVLKMQAPRTPSKP